MSRFSLSFVTILLAISFVLTSCSKEELYTAPVVYFEQSAEIYLNNISLPAILFSYNVFNPETNTQLSYLIDTDGNIRLSESESNLVYEGGVLSPYYMDTKKENSSVSDNYVDLDKLMDSHKRLGLINNIEYNKSAQGGDSQNISTIYGYTFASSTNDEDCLCSSGSEHSEQLFEPVLLEQKVGNTLIQSNTQASGVISWINSLNVQGK